MMAYDHLSYRPRCVEYLAEQLKKGTLTLVLGAGASSGCGLPTWPDLVNRMRAQKGLPSIAAAPDASADILQSAADEVQRKFAGDESGYRTLVKDCLYSGVRLSSAVLQDSLLTALGALMIGSKRGNVRRVLTMNFDSMLEWFLSLYGFVARVVYRQPELEGGEDVRIYHPNGFLPHPDLELPEGDTLILSLKSINERLGTLGDPWFELTRRLLRTGIGLFVGLSPRSFKDRGLAPLLVTVAKEIADGRPIGVWVVVGEEDEGLKSEFVESGVVPLFCPRYEDVPEFLLEICQFAAKGSIVT